MNGAILAVLALVAGAPARDLRASAGEFGDARAIHPERWVTTRDLAADGAGTANIAFVINPQGRVQECRVVAATGATALAASACRLVERRAMLVPPINADGEPVYDKGTMSFQTEAR